MSVQIFLEFLANGFIAKQAPLKSTFHPYFSAALSKAHPVATYQDLAERTYDMYVARLPYDSRSES